MAENLEERKQYLLDQLLARLRERFDATQRPPLERFLRRYYRHVAPEDLLERTLLDLYGAALGHWNLLQSRPHREPVVRVYNPSMEEHGWHSTHTVVEVVCPDQPFLVDSIRIALNRQGLTVHLIVHPVIWLGRDASGEIISVEADREQEQPEAILHFEVDRQSHPEQWQTLREDILRVLTDVRAAVGDWQAMRQELEAAVTHIEGHPQPFDSAQLQEDCAFLRWLAEDHFTFIGTLRFEMDAEGTPQPVAGSGLGVLGEEGGGPARAALLAPRPEPTEGKPVLLMVTQSDARATVHRNTYLDCIGIRRYDPEGRLLGEWRLLGLYTASAYTERPRAIPLVRRKVAYVMDHAGVRSDSYSGKALQHILDTLPRSELFQADAPELFTMAMGVLHLQERQRVRLLVRRDPFGRFYSCLVFLPREVFNTEVRLKVQAILQRAFHATQVDFTVQLSESQLAQLHLIAHASSGTNPDYDIAEIEARLRAASRSWRDELHDALLQEFGEARGNPLFARYRDAFPASYRDDYPAAMAVLDICKMDALSSDNPLDMALYRPLEAPRELLRFKLFSAGNPIALSAVLPMLENMGLRVLGQRPHTIRPSDDIPVSVQDIGMSYQADPQPDTEQVREIFQEAFARVWSGETENDGFNGLVLAAQMPWREVAILRCYSKYLLQTGFPFSQHYMERAITRNPHIASLLVALFKTRLAPDPGEGAEARIEALGQAIGEALEAVPSLDDDRICRRFFAAIGATLRSNYFQAGPKPYISIKLDPSRIPDLPLPRPLYEVFVFSPRMEGIHLRGGKVARGGIRWSDRLEDYRTEIFGLMKTQMVKNAVIVPVGAKGGFVLKRNGGGGRATTEEVLGAYRELIQGLLDITDNLVDGEVVPPPHVVRYDDDDPYLVVAADKGTATFSDTANAIAQEYDFWLGDAFASGGAHGYDHKRMGITARGGWESVKRHFRELGKDIQREPLSVIGIGSMNGDVFGNGMLLSPQIRLLGAFSHREIFLDPDPDPQASFAERQRLFGLPHAAWSDYDHQLISPGGGVYARSAKSIPLSPQVQRMLGVEQDALPPTEVVKALLRAPVELLWNGGIGTFVKASHESHEAAGDRSNDAVRVDADELRFQVVGEGGNLGLTDDARIQYARHGGRINTDFIDNSGGVDCSDHEVNIKILLDAEVKAGELTGKQRNQLLEAMTDEVATLVLHNNYLQTEALSIAEQMAGESLEEHSAFIHELEKKGRLERHTWHLPDNETLAQRRQQGEGLTRPELAVLLAYAKIDLFEAMLDSEVCEDDYLASEITGYFPAQLRERYSEAMANHRLRREIVATFIANSMINRMGITFASRLREQTGASAPDIARAYMVARRVFELPAMWHAIAALDNKVATEHQLRMLGEIRRLGNRATLWFLRNRSQPLDIATTIDFFQGGVAELCPQLFDLVAPEDRDTLAGWANEHIGQGVPETLAGRIGGLRGLFATLDIVEVAACLERPLVAVAHFYFAFGAYLELTWLRDRIAQLPKRNQWERLARAALRDDLYRAQRILTQEALEHAESEAPAVVIHRWREANQITSERYFQRLADFKASETPNLALLSVALNEVRKLIRGHRHAQP